jgi:hypothetical protein
LVYFSIVALRANRRIQPLNIRMNEEPPTATLRSSRPISDFARLEELHHRYHEEDAQHKEPIEGIGQ